jgi:hypothetical protein
MMEKLRIFFIYAWAWTNSLLYRSAVVSEGLMYFLSVQVAVTHHFSGEQQHRYFVAIAHFHGVIGIDVDHIHGEGASLRQSRQSAQHLLAQSAPRT